VLVNLTALRPRYSASRAIVIGIDQYIAAPPLGYAVNDATAVAEMLKGPFAFPEENVRVLTNADATRAAIAHEFLSLASGGTEVDERIVVFFAGHGHTVSSRRGEVGFLVPYDGNPLNLDSLMRWDELTRNADLIVAKHILFLMDACYGGLAVTRALKPGSMRFLKDMLLRPARQVLTAGKANEVVADLGGPLPNHSVFTGHLLEGLGGGAADADGVITANALMAYVYQKVGRDPNSQQTPHFGYLEGDGDLILTAPQLSELLADDQTDTDVLVSVPAVLLEGDQEHPMSVVDQTKELLAEAANRIALHDLVSQEIRAVMSLTDDEKFSVQGQWSDEEFVKRLKGYEEATSQLRSIEALLAYWAAGAQRDTIALAPKRICGRLKAVGGLSAWIALRWYPPVLLLYAGGVSAVAAADYENLRVLMQAKVPDLNRPRLDRTFIRAVIGGIGEVGGEFKRIPGHEKNYVPMSEYLFKLLQPSLDDLLFLGADYERAFDDFEVLMALEYAEQYETEKKGRIWGPIGRFGYKFSNDNESSPLHRTMSSAEAAGASWPPVQAGMFRGSIERFREIASTYRSEIVARLGWW
jgi:uncharacterized caspase-like protein